jgi:hypothetical protein
MAWISRALVLLCACSVADEVAALPRILSLNVAQSSLEAHHTVFYQVEQGFVVRRGQPFDLTILTDAPVDATTTTFSLVTNDVDDGRRTPFAVAFKEVVGDNRYVLTVSTESSAPVGKYEHATLLIQTLGSTSSYVYEHPIYLIFNPWIAEDTSVFIPSETMREEYVLTEYGNVYHPGNPVTWGDQSVVEYQKWHYGH